MSDTRTIYLKNNEGAVYSSDPSTNGYEYLNMSDFDSLNPSDNSIFTSASNTSLLYSSYDVKLVLTFMSDYDNGRQARAEWVAQNQNSINQISVANTNNPNLIFSKQAKIKTIDFVENPYVNGVQAELTLELAGRWQSSVKRTRATVYPYTGGTKKYAYHYSTLNRDLLVGRNLLLDSKTQTRSGAWYSPNTSWTEESGDYLGSHINRVSSGWSNTRYNFKDLVDRGVINTTDDFTYSIYFRVVGEDPAGMSYTYINFLSSATTKNFTTPIQLTSLEEGQWTRIVVPIKFITDKYDSSSAYSQALRIEVSTGPKVNGAYYEFAAPMLERGTTVTPYKQAPEDTDQKPTYKYGYQIITDEVKTDGYNGFIINIPSQTTPVNVTLTAPNGLSATIKTSQTNVPLQISSDMIGYSLDNFDTFTLLNKGFPASKYWDNLLSVYSTIQTILNFNTVTVSVTSGTGTSIPFEFYLYKLQDLI